MKGISKNTPSSPPSEVQKWGETWRLADQSESAVLYERFDGQKPVGVIVAKIRRHKKDRFMRGRVISAAGDFMLPGESQFGTTAWNYLATVRGREKALAKFAEISI